MKGASGTDWCFHFTFFLLLLYWTGDLIAPQASKAVNHEAPWQARTQEWIAWFHLWEKSGSLLTFLYCLWQVIQIQYKLYRKGLVLKLWSILNDRGSFLDVFFLKKRFYSIYTCETYHFQILWKRWRRHAYFGTCKIINLEVWISC